MPMYHDGNRGLQDRFASRHLADRLVEKLDRNRFKAEDKAFIESMGYFFLATADANGHPDCSFKGGPLGFVQIVRDNLLVFPDYDGNGMFKSLGNIKQNPHVGLLFIAMGEKPQRLRVNGRASLHFEHQMMSELPGAQLIIEVIPEHIFPNCPRYIPNLQTGEASQYIPNADVKPIEPAWKGFDIFKNVVPPRRR
jgi:uncharacterized protein